MIGRLLVSVGAFALGYYLGKQVGLTEHVRKALEDKSDDERPGTEPETREARHRAPGGAKSKPAG
jgi:hypothetical protein